MKKQEHLNEFIGLTKKKAQNKAEKLGYKHRITEEDGKYYVITHDFRMDRVNFKIIKGKVTEIDLG